MYSGAAADYALAGWPCVIPVPPDAKFPPPAGFTGAAGADTTTDDIVGWAGNGMGSWSIALRMPDGVVGIDVDDYVKNGTVKAGAATLARLEAELGPLPATWSSTARGTAAGPGPSRISFYTVPSGRYATRLGADIDVIQRHHRYAVVAPSPHAGAGARYRWYRPDGTPAADGEVPSPAGFPALPDSWAKRLAEGASPAGPPAADPASGRALLDWLLSDQRMPCAEADEAGRQAAAELAGTPAGSRHDAMTSHVYHVIQLGAEGHAGAGSVLGWLEQRWEELTGAENRGAEFDRMLLTAARKAAGRAIPDPYADPCMDSRALGWDALATVQGGELDPDDALEAPVQWSPRHAWGAHLFTTAAQLDSVLARDVLMRTWPGLRYAADAGTWLLRGPLRWEARPGEQARWAVEEMFWLLPRGDSTAPEGTEPHEQAKRRARFGTNAGAGAVAGKMAAQVMSGHHPCALDMAALDHEPEILWAGGLPWDLRASGDGPVQAPLDLGTVHMHAAGCAPRPGPTPLWDRFLAAMWPEEADRAWALRVMAVAFTGHPEKTLPILLGPTDRGKTEFIKMLMSVLGTYALKSADARLLSAADRSHASIVYALKGCRLAFIDEAPRTGQLAQERLKALTGGAPLTGNRMGENPITFDPTHTLVLTANPDHEPVLTDPAVRRRVRLIPCEGDPEEIRARRAEIGFLSGPAWRREAPAVLARMMAEAAAWLAGPLSADNRAAPPRARELAARIAADQDVIERWVTEECEPSDPMPSRALYKNFVASCKDAGIAPQAIPNETRWGRRLSELGYPSAHSRTGWFRRLRVRPAGGFFPPAEPVTPSPGDGGAPGGGAGPRDGFTPPGDGFVTGSAETRHTENASSDPVNPALVTGVTGSHTHITHTHAHTPAHTHAHMQGSASNPSHPSQPVTEPLTSGNAGAGPGQPVTAPVTNPSRAPGGPPAPVTGAVTGTVVFDLEGGSADDLFTYRPWDEQGYVRLAGRLEDGGQPAITTDVRELLDALGRAPEITGHNILGFDLLALAHHHGADYEALAAKAKDTELIARQADPPRSRESGTSADRYGLDAVAARLGVPGKTDELARLKRQFGGYDKIPLDNAEYRSYLEGDLRASEAVSARLGNDGYTRREHRLAALAGRMSLNGFAVDVPLLEERLAQGAERKQAALGLLHDAWGLPLSRTVARGRGKARQEVTEAVDSPLSTEAGREWLAAVLEGHGVTVPRTPKKGKPAVGDEQLKAIAADPRCPASLRQLITLVKIVVGTRTVYQTAADCLAPDGRVHPFNSFRQASGRWSVTNPGLTVFGKHHGRHVERDIFIPDPGHVLLCFDLKQVDMRAMAGHCQDPAYMALFAPGRDAHAEIAAQVGIKRQDAKAIGHGWNYGLGASRMIRNGLDETLVRRFIAGMEERFPVLIAWREEIRERGKAGDVLDNGFGRRMACDPERAYTVAPALMGQGGARDIMGECLLRLDRSLLPLLRTMVHDEIVMSVPAADAADVARQVIAAMTWTWRGVPILCDMSGGRSWGEASAK